MPPAKKRISSPRKKPVHRNKPWFFWLGIIVAVLGMVVTAGVLLRNATPKAQVMAQTQQQVQEQAPMAKGKAPQRQAVISEQYETTQQAQQVGPPLTPNALKEWIDVIVGALNNVGGVFMTMGGAVMLWLNIKEKKQDLEEKEEQT